MWKDASSKCLLHLLITWKDYLLIVLTLGRRFCRNNFELYIDLFFNNFVLIDKALAPHVLYKKHWNWPNCTFSLQIDKNVYSHKGGYKELSFLFFPLKNQFKGEPFVEINLQSSKPIHIVSIAKGEKRVHCQQLPKQTLG